MGIVCHLHPRAKTRRLYCIAVQPVKRLHIKVLPGIIVIYSEHIDGAKKVVPQHWKTSETLSFQHWLNDFFLATLWNERFRLAFKNLMISGKLPYQIHISPNKNSHSHRAWWGPRGSSAGAKLYSVYHHRREIFFLRQRELKLLNSGKLKDAH